MNPMTVNHDTKLIPLNQGKVTIVDAADYDFLMQWKWYCSTLGYAVRMMEKAKPRKIVWMHRVIMQTPKGMETDHINTDRLDNRRSNLRVCTLAENQRNKKKKQGLSSRYKGVSWIKRDCVWRAQIEKNNNNKHIGNFSTEIEAALAYDNAAKEHFGEFANINFL
jgi:hypothetical protein